MSQRWFIGYVSVTKEGKTEKKNETPDLGRSK